MRYTGSELACLAVSAFMTALAVFFVVVDGDRRLVWAAVFFGACTLIAVLSPWLTARTARLRDRKTINDGI